MGDLEKPHYPCGTALCRARRYYVQASEAC
jgi:hypothetical protein